MLGGMEKTFRSWLLCFIAVAVASGKDCFGDDRFPVVTQDGVVFFTGEAGRFALERRLRRIATQLYGMTDEEDDQLPLYVADERAILGSDRFLNALRTAIADHVPVLVEIDPLYPYVGSNTEAGNMFAVGDQLHAVSEICNEANVSLIVSHHPAEDGTGQHTDADGSDPGGRTRPGEGVVAGQPRPAEPSGRLRVAAGPGRWVRGIRRRLRAGTVRGCLQPGSTGEVGVGVGLVGRRMPSDLG
jgi:RecA-family ATPase